MSLNRIGSRVMPERLGTLARLPLFFALNGRRAVISGGGMESGAVVGGRRGR
jgi:hypothetical protein